MKPKHTPEELAAICAPYAALSELECDGLSRVLHQVLAAAGIEASMHMGEVTWNGAYFLLHVWLEVDGWAIDYRLRMWLGAGAPHGVFRARDAGVLYRGRVIEPRPLPPPVFALFTRGVCGSL